MRRAEYLCRDGIGAVIYQYGQFVPPRCQQGREVIDLLRGDVIIAACQTPIYPYLRGFRALHEQGDVLSFPLCWYLHLLGIQGLPHEGVGT